MRINSSFGQQLVLKEIILVPGGEWTPRLPGWSLIGVSRGAGYWMDTRLNYDLACGSVLVVSEPAQGMIRCSQVCEMVLHCFCVQPEKLSGIITLGEQKILHETARSEGCGVRLLPAGHAVAEDFERLYERQNGCAPRLRLQLLELFIRAFERELSAKNPGSLSKDGAKARLEILLKQLHPADMLELRFGDLSAKVGCSPRHLGRVFQHVVGVSFREKQVQVRLGQAQELLATTKSKVVEVALESGYQSLSLFNLMFKRRFGVTPAQWRQRRAEGKVSGRASSWNT